MAIQGSMRQLTGCDPMTFHKAIECGFTLVYKTVDWVWPYKVPYGGWLGVALQSSIRGVVGCGLTKFRKTGGWVWPHQLP